MEPGTTPQRPEERAGAQVRPPAKVPSLWLELFPPEGCTTAASSPSAPRRGSPSPEAPGPTGLRMRDALVRWLDARL